MDYRQVERLVKSTKFIIEKYNGKEYSLKGRSDFVTQVDIDISSYLKTELLRLDDSIGFFSEEEEGRLRSDCWILDPVDGTTNLVYGYNMSAVSLARYKDGEIVFGIVYNPFTEEAFTAEKGKGAYLNGEKISVSERDIKDAIVEFGAGSTHKENAEENFALAKEIFLDCIDIRRICSTALTLCFIAAGRIDGYFERVLKPWDIAAGCLIIREAGGELCDYLGKPLQFAASTSVIAGNKRVKEYLHKKIKGQK